MISYLTREEDGAERSQTSCNQRFFSRCTGTFSALSWWRRARRRACERSTLILSRNRCSKAADVVALSIDARLNCRFCNGKKCEHFEWQRKLRKLHNTILVLKLLTITQKDTNYDTGDWTYVRLGVVRCYSMAECFVGSSISPSHNYSYLPVPSRRIASRWSETDIRSTARGGGECSRCRRSGSSSRRTSGRSRGDCMRLSGPSCLLRSKVLLLLSCRWLFVLSGEWLRSSMMLEILWYQRVVLLFS